MQSLTNMRERLDSMKNIFNSKIVFIIAVILFTLLSLTIYQIFVRDWIKPAKIDIESLKGTTYFNNKTIENRTEVLDHVFRQGQNAQSYLNANGYWYTNNEEGYKRNIYFDSENEYIKIYYTIFDKMVTINKDENQASDSTNTSPFYFHNYGYVTVYIAVNNDDLDSGLNTILPKTAMASGAFISESSSMSEFEAFLDFKYGRIRPIFRIVSQKGKSNQCDYYITPLCFTRGHWGLVNSDSSELRMMFVFDKYIIHIDEWTYNRGKYDSTQLVIDDVCELLIKADKSYPVS